MTEAKNIYDQVTICELSKWLEALYSDGESPLLNPDVHDIESLLKLKNLNEEVEKNAKEIIKTNKNIIKNYDEKSKEIEDLIKSEVNLADETMKQIESIAELAVKLNLEEPDETNFLMAICDLQNNELKKTQQRSQQTFTFQTLSDKIIKVEEQNEIIEKEINKLEEIVEIQASQKDKVKEHLDMTIKKTANYDRSIQAYKDNLLERGFTDSIRHHKLVEKAEELQKLKDEFQIMLDKYEGYQSLPASQMLANLQLENKRQELKALEESFSKLLEKQFV